MFSYLTSAGHSHHDLLWSYPVQTVYDFYTAAVSEERRNKYGLAQMLRMTGMSSRDLSKKGAQSVNSAWDSLLKALEPDKRKKTTSPSRSKNTSEKTTPQVVAHQKTPEAQKAASAANAFLSAGDFTPVKMEKKK